MDIILIVSVYGSFKFLTPFLSATASSLKCESLNYSTCSIKMKKRAVKNCKTLFFHLSSQKKNLFWFPNHPSKSPAIIVQLYHLAHYGFKRSQSAWLYNYKNEVLLPQLVNWTFNGHHHVVKIMDYFNFHHNDDWFCIWKGSCEFLLDSFYLIISQKYLPASRLFLLQL